MTNKVEVTPPNFGLQKKLGAPVKHLPLAVLSAADKALARHAQTFDAFFQSVLDRWKSAPNMPIDELYQDAHDLRGLAGTFDRVALGRVADALCVYIEGARNANAPADPEAVKAIRDALTTCAALEKSDPDASAKLAERAREAVQVKVAAFNKA